MAKRLNSMPLIIRQDDTASAVVRLDPTPKPIRAATSNGRKTPLQASQIRNGQGQGGQDRDVRSHNGHSHNGHSHNGHERNGRDRDDRSHSGGGRSGEMPHGAITDDVRQLIRDHRLDEANRIVAGLLDRRIADGDNNLGAVSMLLQHYDIILSRQPPLSHIGAEPLRPNDCLYACFDRFIDLIRQQQNQVSELQAIIAELI